MEDSIFYKRETRSHTLVRIYNTYTVCVRIMLAYYVRTRKKMKKNIPFEVFPYSIFTYILGQVSNPEMACLSHHFASSTT